MAEEIELHHLLEHLGQQISVIPRVIKELYGADREVCLLCITMSHPGHADVSTDPSYVRAIKPGTLGESSRNVHEFCRSIGVANTSIADICEVNFALQSNRHGANNVTLQNPAKVGIEIAEQDAHPYAEFFGNVIKQVAIEVVIKNPVGPRCLPVATGAEVLMFAVWLANLKLSGELL